MRKTFVILLAVAAVCGCRQGYKMECGQSFELATPWVLNHDGGSESLTVSVPGTVAGALERIIKIDGFITYLPIYFAPFIRSNRPDVVTLY